MPTKQEHGELMKRILVTDRVSYSINKNTRREYTDEGFLKVPGRVARTGIQQYLAVELGLTDRNPNEIINVYRPPEEVFAVDSLATYNGVDLTDNHPNELVNADTYKTVTRGAVISVGRVDGDFVEVDIIAKDAEAIKHIESGKVQLSAGYTSNYDHSPGVTPAGEKYEFIQRDIRINHVALVDRARAGFMARLHDNKPTGLTKMFKVNLDSGRTVELENEATATLVNDTIERLAKRVTDAEAETEEEKKKREEAEAAKDAAEAEAKEEKAKSTDAAISARIAEVTATIDSARKIAGDDFTCESVDSVEIKRAALIACNDSIDFSEKSATYIEAAFDMAVAKPATNKPAPAAQHSQLSQDAAQHQQPNDNQPIVSHRQKAADSMSSAWKRTTGEA